MKTFISLFFALFSCILMAQVQEKDSIQSAVLLNNGIDPFFSYASIAASNVSGGIDQASNYAGQFYTGINLDLNKILGWKNMRAKISMINRHGSGLEKEVGSVFEPLNIVGGQNTFLYDLSIEKDFGDKISLKLGRTTSVDDFSASKLYFYALNNTVNGVIRALLLDGLTTTFPFATWGTRLKYKPDSKHQLQLGVYQLSKTVFNDEKHGLDFAFRSSDDLSVFFQYDWFGEIAGCDSRIYVGANQVFGEIPNFDNNISEYFLRLYGHIDVKLIDNLSSFLTLSYSNHGEIAKVPFQSSLGLNWKGAIKSREEDRLLFFATIGTFSDEWSRLQGSELSPEVILELGYRFQITDYFVFQPALQYDINPGGSGVIKTAIIPGVWIEANF